ncbi:MAG: nuclear transport factor 2 family protein [Candidatus Limnocylindria bacterium]
MTDTPRQLFDRWIEAINKQDREVLASVLHPDYTDEMPQSGERTRGAANLFAILDNFPDFEQMRNNVSNAELIGAEARWVLTPNFTVVQVVGEAEVYTVTGRARYPDGSLWYMIVLARLKDGLIHRTTTYYAPEFPAPEWRSQWVEPMGPPPK